MLEWYNDYEQGVKLINILPAQIEWMSIECKNLSLLHHLAAVYNCNSSVLVTKTRLKWKFVSPHSNLDQNRSRCYSSQRSWPRFLEIIHFNGVVWQFFIITMFSTLLNFKKTCDAWAEILQSLLNKYNSYCLNYVDTKHKICLCTSEFFIVP
jgi:hypothetical protein